MALFLEGAVVSVDGTALTIQSADHVTRTLTLTDTTLIVAPDGSATTVAAGDEVRIIAHVYDGSAPVAVVVEDYSSASTNGGTSASGDTSGADATATPAPEQTAQALVYRVLDGTITALDDTSLTLQTSDGTHTFPLGDRVSVRLPDHTRGSISQLSVGVAAYVYLRSTDGGPFVVVGVVCGGSGDAPAATPSASSTPSAEGQDPTETPSQPTQGATYGPVQRINGTITALDNASLTVQGSDGAQTFPLCAHVSILLADGTGTTDVTQIPTGVYASVYLRSVAGAPLAVCGIVVGGQK